MRSPLLLNRRALLAALSLPLLRIPAHAGSATLAASAPLAEGWPEPERIPVELV